MSTEIKAEVFRYDLDMDGSMEPWPEGRWVRWDDYAALVDDLTAQGVIVQYHEAALARQAAEITALIAALQGAKT